MAGCRCSLLLLSQHIRLDQWPELAGICWKESITRVCHAAVLCREAELWDRSNRNTYTINHWQNFAMFSFHNIFPLSSPSITTDFFLYRRTTIRKMFCWSLGLFHCATAFGINFFILSLTLVSIFLSIQFSCKILNFFRPSPSPRYPVQGTFVQGNWRLKGSCKEKL